MTDNDCRAAFEKWLPTKGYMLGMRDDGKYASSHTEIMWQAWQAAQPDRYKTGIKQESVIPDAQRESLHHALSRVREAEAAQPEPAAGVVDAALKLCKALNASVGSQPLMAKHKIIKAKEKLEAALPQAQAPKLEDTQACEACGAVHEIEKMTSDINSGWFCPDCIARWNPTPKIKGLESNIEHPASPSTAEKEAL